jgi:hypothetical protein
VSNLISGTVCGAETVRLDSGPEVRVPREVLAGRTGAVAGRTELPQLGSTSDATDGRDLLVMTASDGVDGRMTGFDLATGEETRQIAYPEGVSDVLQVHGVLVGWAYATNEVTVLR